MIGAEYIAEFLRQRGTTNVFLLTGGACTFIVDAIGRNEGMQYTCFQHEQSASMAADSLWRIDGTVGATVATSGPGATNLITGIACSYFDSTPTIHITGQVNQVESANFVGTKARQLGFQETNIVDMVKPITKYAVQVKNGADLKKELAKAWNIAISDRKGPVLIDVPMNVQKEEVGDVIEYSPLPNLSPPENDIKKISDIINGFLEGAKRPLILFGAGIGLAGSHKQVERFLLENNMPFVSSWNGMTYFNHDIKNYCGSIGVYGNRGANFLIQNCDRLLVLGSRLDNRQRSGNTDNFAIAAKVLVVDIDKEELKKYNHNGYDILAYNLKYFSQLKPFLSNHHISAEWQEFISNMKEKYFTKDISKFSTEHSSLSPYKIIKKINHIIEDDAIIVGDTGASLCWLFQTFHRTNQTIYTAGGNSPMGYSLPASIGAALHCPDQQIISVNGDGGFQLNMQELQTIKNYNLNIKIIIFNNSGYGIIKQFQDLYFDGRYEASGKGYSCPNMKKIASAYDIEYHHIETLDDLDVQSFSTDKAAIFNVILHENTLIEPKLELGKPIHDQFPYLSDNEFKDNSKYCNFTRDSIQRKIN